MNSHLLKHKNKCEVEKLKVRGNLKDAKREKDLKKKFLFLNESK
jgi:hypothetical protein